MGSDDKAGVLLLMVFLFTTLVVISSSGQVVGDGDLDEDTLGTWMPRDGGGGKRGLGPLYRTTGRVLGFLGLAFTIVLAFTGGAYKGWRRKMNRLFGNAKKRMRVHCWLSGALLAIVVVHAALLMYGHYRDLVWNGFFLMAEPGNPSINLGTWALVLMIIISFQGIFKKQLVKKIGRKKWGLLHGYVTYAALILVVIHLLWIGTTIGQPLREALL